MPHMAARMAMIFSRLVCSFINFRLQLRYIGRQKYACCQGETTISRRLNPQ